tara:strand:- start:11064 stop:11483 length:420 start_codon:yes stop_codon:yes gene_type:complete
MRSLLLALALTCASCGPATQIPAPVDVADPPQTAIVTESGLVYAVLKKGGGTTPRANDKVSVHYTGWTVDGAMFDSSVAKGRPANFVVNEVIAGWTEALLLMKTGSKYRLWIPEELAYRGEAGFPAGTLVFDVSLISIE